MNLLLKLEYLNKEKNELNQKYLSVKKEFEQYIVNKNYPLLQRWNIYIKADEELKNKKRYIFSPKSKYLKYVFENSFNASEIYGRGKEIYLEKLFDEIVDTNEIYLDNVNYDKTNFKKEDIENSLEEILELNLYSFTYDW